MSEKKIAIGLSGLAGFGLSLDAAIDGKLVTAAKATNRKNVFQMEIADDNTGKNKRHLFVGAKSIEEGMLLKDEETGEVTVAKGFEAYANADGEMWVRNKANASKKLEVIG